MEEINLKLSWGKNLWLHLRLPSGLVFITKQQDKLLVFFFFLLQASLETWWGNS